MQLWLGPFKARWGWRMALLDDALRAAGGMDRWCRVRRFTAYLSIDGYLLRRKGKAGLLKDVVAEGCTETQSLCFTGFTDPEKRASYRPDRVTIEGLDGSPIETRGNPGMALPGQIDDAPWDDLHLAYFCGFSVWNYLMTPFLLAREGVQTKELPPAAPDHTCRRLRAVFPSDIVTHAPTQVFSFDPAGLECGIEYSLGEAHGAQIVHRSWAHQKFSDIIIPTLRQSLLIQSGGAIIAKPPFVDIEIFDASFE